MGRLPNPGDIGRGDSRAALLVTENRTTDCDDVLSFALCRRDRQTEGCRGIELDRLRRKRVKEHPRKRGSRGQDSSAGPCPRCRGGDEK